MIKFLLTLLVLLTSQAAQAITVSSCSGFSGSDTILFYDSSEGECKPLTIGTNLTITGSTLDATGGGGTPGGADTSFQYNNAGSFGGINTEAIFTDGTDVYAGTEFFHYFKAGSALTANFKFDTSGLSDLRQIVVQDTSGTMALLADIPSISGLVPYTGATANVDLGTFDLITDTITSDSSSGLILETNSGGDVLHIGNGGGVNATAYGGWNFDAATANTLSYFGASKTLSSVTLSGLTLTTGTLSVDAASDTVAGKVELATTAEINTGTDTGRAVTPDALAGSYAGTRPLGMSLFAHNSAVVVVDKRTCTRVPSSFNGMNMVAVGAAVNTTSSSGTPTVQLSRGRQSTPTSAHSYVDMLSTRITVDASEYDSKDATTAPVIDTANDDVATGDLICADVDVAGTGTQGLIVNMEFRLP